MASFSPTISDQPAHTIRRAPETPAQSDTGPRDRGHATADRRRTRVALVDDHPVFRAGLKQWLALEADLEVTSEGRDGTDAIAIARAGRADVLLIDVAMPGRSGLEALQEIRAFAPDLRILVLSGYPEEHYGKRMIQLGADGYLHKSSDPDQLVVALRTVIEGRRHLPAVTAAQFAAEWIERDMSPEAQLSEREYQIMVKLASGLTLQTVATGLGLSPKSVSGHRSALMKKLGLSSNVELTYFALKHNLLQFAHPFR